jgi:hypothetical protein
MKRYLHIAFLAGWVGCGGGSSGTGTAGTTGTPGSAGTTGGGAGTTGTPGTAGTTATAGTTGTPGTAGTTPTAGTTGTPGTAGTSSAGTSGAGTSGNAGRGGTTATAGTTGNAGRGGTGTAGTTATAGTTGTGGAPATNQSVLERNKNPSKDGHFIQPTLTKAAAATMMPDAAFNTAATFSGNVLGTVLFLDGTPNGKFFVGTTDNNVVARNEDGSQAWAPRSVGTPVTGMLGCSSFGTATPLGILSTGVIDATSRTLYVAAIIGGASGPTGHIVSAINTDDGTVRSGWPVNVSTMLNFDATIHNQRSALSLVNGIVYVSYGGFVGDCGNYRGRVVAVSTSSPGTMGQWATAGQGEGIWHMGGTASDGNGVITVTGNRTGSSSGGHQDSEQVTRVTGMGTKADYFYPTDWMQKDSADADFGSVNPVVINVPGASPSSLVAAISKDGHFYLLNAAMLRGSTSGTAAGGQLADFRIAASGMSIHSVPAAYRTAMGSYVLISTTSGAQGCPSGTGGRRLMAIKINPGNLAMPSIAWCADMATVTTGAIATTTDGTSDAVVWYTSGGSLRGVDGDTGAVIYSATNTCAGVARWTTPIAVKGRIVVAGNGRLCAWGIPSALTQASPEPLKTGKRARKLASLASSPL